MPHFVWFHIQLVDKDALSFTLRTKILRSSIFRKKKYLRRKIFSLVILSNFYWGYLQNMKKTYILKSIQVNDSEVYVGGLPREARQPRNGKWLD